MSGWIGVDLDGTLAEYNGWVSEQHIGKPVPLMVERVKRWLVEGKEVRIFTARVDGGQAGILMGDENSKRFEDVKAIKAVIEKWCMEHIGVILPITNIKDYGMIQLWDDRCVQVVANTGMTIQEWMAGIGAFAERTGI